MKIPANRIIISFNGREILGASTDDGEPKSLTELAKLLQSVTNALRLTSTPIELRYETKGPEIKNN